MKPSGMLVGVLAGLAAGAFWGMTFVAPLLLPDFGSVDVTVGRFVACGLFSLLLWLGQDVRHRFMLAGDVARAAHWPTLTQAAAALGLSVLGYTGYYLLLVLAIQDAGAALPVLIIGTIPLWMMLLGKPQSLRWRALLPGLLLTALGMALMMQVTLHTPAGDVAGGAAGSASGTGLVWHGVLYAVAAMVSWTAFGLLNAAWLRRHPAVNATDWANWLGMAAGLGALLLWAWWGTDWASLSQREGFGRFVAVCAFTGIGSAWIAAVFWNVASRRLSPSLAGQLIVSETVFGLLYSFVWSAQWPGLWQGLACVLFVLGILASIQAHR